MKKTSQTIYALTRTASLMDVDKRRSVMEAFVSSYFNYCLLVWMFHDRGLNNNINRIYERSLRSVYGDNKFSFEKR